MKKNIFLFLGLSLIPTISYSQSFNELIDSVIINNTSLKSAQAVNESELLNAKSENALSDPETEIEHQWGRHGADNKFGVSVSQGFDWPGAYAARSKAIKTKANALEFLNQSNELDKRLEIKLLYIDIINNKKNRRLLDERVEIMNQLIEKYSRGVELGQLSRLDLNKLKIEKLRLTNSRLGIETEYDNLKSSLEKLNGGMPCDGILDNLDSYPDDAILPVEEYDRLLAESDPQSKYQEAIAEAQMQTVKAEKMMRFPGFSVGYIHSREEGNVFNGVSFGVSLPAFSTRNKIKAAEALRKSLSYDRSLLEVERRADMLANRHKALDLYKKYDGYLSVMKNDDSIEQLKKSLAGGEISIIDYLSEMDYFLVVNQEMLQLEYEYMIALANLNKYLLLR